MNDQLLQLFEEAEGVFLSGEELSSRLNISRTAIWKQIERLREQGYLFEAVPRKGYRLISKPDKLELTELISKLTTRSLGRTIKYFESLDSTQNVAHQLVNEGAAEGTLVLAERQTAGRGRMGRKWHSPKGKGIWFSLVLRPSIPLQFTPQLTLLVAVALCRAIRSETELPVGIKWPNDLLINGKKICGILLESSAEDERLKHVIAGVGISANLFPDDFPEELRGVATSLSIEAGKPIDRVQLLCRFLSELEQLYDLYLAEGFTPIKLLWEALNVSLHRPLRSMTPQGLIEGYAESMDDSGALVVRLDDGNVTKIYSGDVEFR
jgi:BirA family transcriptional regulator, biotin operon repressor / biotin---[acetyl-CoA-carboxylase] ligase